MSWGWAPTRARIYSMLTYSQVLRKALQLPSIRRKKRKTKCTPKEPLTFESLPGEIITVIALSTVRKNGEEEQYILSTKDLRNLRYVNKHTNLRVQHAFGLRCFRHRNHMISEFGLGGLRDIARHPVFGDYVREVSLGPERVPEKQCPMHRALYPINMGDEHPQLEVLRNNQAIFESNGDAAQLLKDALGSLSKLRKIIIRSYPRPYENKNFQYHGYGWSAPWGLSTLSAGMNGTPVNSTAPDRAFFGGEDWSNWHLDIILQALRVIVARPDWTIDFDLNSDERYIQSIGIYRNNPAIPFSVHAQNWTSVQHRVRQISLHRTILGDGRRCAARVEWLTELFRGCGKGVETLQCHNTTYWAGICNNAPLPNLRHLDIRGSTFPEGHLRKFFEDHKGTLETIKFDSVDLINWDPVANTNYTAWRLSWTAQFSLMLEMPHLRKIELRHLSWMASAHEVMPEGVQYVIEGYGWSRSVTAEGANVGLVLRAAVDNNAISREKKKYTAWDTWHRHRGHWVMFSTEEGLR